jgi:hypothetical protein
VEGWEGACEKGEPARSSPVKRPRDEAPPADEGELATERSNWNAGEGATVDWSEGPEEGDRGE